MNDETVNHDELWAKTYTPEDRESVKKVAADSLLASGKYLKIGTAVVTKQSTFKRNNVEITRPNARVQAHIADLKDSEQKRGVQFFGVSPVRFNQLDRETGADTGKPDRLSQMYQQAYQAFKKVAGRDPESPSEVLDFLENQPYTIRVIQVGTGDNATGEPGNMVVGLSPLVQE